MGTNLLIKATREAVWSSARNSISVCIMIHEKWAGEGPYRGWVQERGAHAAEQANWAKVAFWMRTPRFTYSWPLMSTPATSSLPQYCPLCSPTTHCPFPFSQISPHSRTTPKELPQDMAASSMLSSFSESVWALRRTPFICVLFPNIWIKPHSSQPSSAARRNPCLWHCGEPILGCCGPLLLPFRTLMIPVWTSRRVPCQEMGTCITWVHHLINSLCVIISSATQRTMDLAHCCHDPNLSFGIHHFLFMILHITCISFFHSFKLQPSSWLDWVSIGEVQKKHGSLAHLFGSTSRKREVSMSTCKFPHISAAWP